MEDSEIKKIITEVSRSMEKKGYDPVTQIIGYLMSNDLGYIPEFDDNRNKMTTIDRSLMLEEMLKEYLK